MRLEIPRDAELERRTWIFERISWSAMAVVMLAALLGLFGPGVLGRTVAVAEAGALSLEYRRFVRARSPTLLRVRFEPADASAEAAVWLSGAYLESFAAEAVRPTPASVALGSNRVRYLFRLTGAPGPVTVTFRLDAHDVGRVRGEVGLEDGPALRFWQFVYP